MRICLTSDPQVMSQNVFWYALTPMSPTLSLWPSGQNVLICKGNYFNSENSFISFRLSQSGTTGLV